MTVLWSEDRATSEERREERRRTGYTYCSVTPQAEESRSAQSGTHSKPADRGALSCKVDRATRCRDSQPLVQAEDNDDQRHGRQKQPPGMIFEVRSGDHLTVSAINATETTAPMTKTSQELDVEGGSVARTKASRATMPPVIARIPPERPPLATLGISADANDCEADEFAPSMSSRSGLGSGVVVEMGRLVVTPLPTRRVGSVRRGP